jgi:serine/threonine protein kinase
MPEQRVNILIYRPDGTLVAQYLLGDGEHLIGRDINCPIYLDSEYISSNHAKLHLSAEGIYIEDLNSTSGTFLDGVTVRGKLRIKPGQVLQVGDLTVDLQPESVDNVGPGSRLGDGRYTLIRLLGRGGMGEVWLAKDEQLDEEVALKKIPHEVAADAMALADMRREVQKSRGLTHQNIIRIHDLYFKPGEDPFISLEYVDGRDLTHIIATKTNGIFPWEEIKPLVLQLCEALEYAHGQKIVHRDLKPANLMITRDSQLKLADFGIAATMVDSLSRSSIQGFVSGTTLYMSPQQMEGEAPQASDDIYAFGATLYELLTSRPPFYTGDMQHQVQQVIPKPMEQRLQEFGFTNNIPEYVQKLVMSCLAKEPEGRPKSMGAIRKWIESEGKDKEVIPKPTTKTIRRTIRREPLEPELTPAKKGAKYAALAAVIAVVIGLGFWAKNQIEDLGNGQQPAQVSGASKTKVKGGTNTPTVQPTNSSSTGGTGPTIVTPLPSPTIVVTPKPEPVTPPPIPNLPPLTPTPQITPESLKKGLTGYFPFNGNAKDESGNNFHGKPQELYKLTTDQRGLPNSAYQFDGELGYIALPSGVHRNTKDKGTVSLWFKTPPKGTQGHFFSAVASGHAVHRWISIANDGKVAAGLGSPGATLGNKKTVNGTWNHVCLLWRDNNDSAEFYINGQFAGKNQKKYWNLANPDWIYIATRRVGNDRLNISVSDVRFYNRDLSAAEVKQLYDLERKKP